MLNLDPSRGLVRWCASALACLAVVASAAENPDALESPATQLLEKRCLVCHNAATKSAGLDLSSLASALEGGQRGPALVPGKADASVMFQRIEAGEMPLGNPLPPEERELVRLWIEAGAPWSGKLGRPTEARPRANADWWSLQPLSAPEPPAPDGLPEAWAGSPIDRWVYAKLRQEGLDPAPPADRRTLIRRAFFDLVGLPPTPKQIEAFVADRSENAYEKLIDRLLASPHYGERWGRHWLDVARFAESEGFERDWLRENAWPYRDYVIRSFNEDKSYQQFAKEQIAGDVLEPVSRDGVIATGLLVFGPHDAIGLTSAVEQQRAQVREDQLEEMLGTVSQTFLGMTVNCARCHDHKFDPISQREYYRLKAAFEGVWQGERPLLTPAEVEARRQRLEPLQNRIAELEDQMAGLELPARERLLGRRGFRWAPSVPRPMAQWTFDLNARDLAGALHASLPPDFQLRDGRLVAGPEPTLPQEEPGAAATPPLPRDLRDKTLETWVWVGKQLPEKPASVLLIRNTEGYRGAAFDGIRYTAGEKKQWLNLSTANFRTSDVHGPPEQAAAGERIHLAIVYRGDGTIAIYRNGKPYGEPYKPEFDGDPGKLQTYFGGEAVINLRGTPGLEIDEARVYDAALSGEQVAASYQAGAPSVSRDELRQAMTAAERSRYDALRAEWADVKGELESLPEPVPVYAADIKDPDPTFVLRRGDPSQKGERVAAGGLSCVETLPAEFGLAVDAPEDARRLKLAEWVTNARNPLFSRVMANRIWHYHFGAGFVRNPNDLGYNGGEPSHPELLDWLAGQFIAEGWSVKKLHKLMMLSATYQQSSRFNPEAAARDADNRLLWRFSPQRLEGEAVRDAMLAVSGGMNWTMGGPGFRPFTSVRFGSLETFTPVDSGDPELQRRAVYRMNVNSAPHPMLDSLDCPIPSVKTPSRAVTTTPLQALSLMNDAFVVRLAKAFAERVRREAGAQPRAQTEHAFRLALGRLPHPEEAAWSEVLLQQHGLESLCWGLFNTSEFLYVN